MAATLALRLSVRHECRLIARPDSNMTNTKTQRRETNEHVTLVKLHQISAPHMTFLCRPPLSLATQ